MSRNPNKTRCQVPGCRNWAMRGHTHCRPHRDPELGPRGAGAPTGNLNALSTGDHAHPLSSSELQGLAHRIQSYPDRLVSHRRCSLALAKLPCARRSRGHLVADGIFLAELHDLLQQKPPAGRNRAELTLWRHALNLSPVDKLEPIRQLRRKIDSHPAPPVLNPDPPDDQ